MSEENSMRNLRIEKITVNIGVGSAGQRLEHAKELLKKLTNKTPMETAAKKRNPVFGLRKGLKIGAKVTLRGKEATEFLVKAFVAKKKTISGKNFDRTGNVSFGVSEYIDFPGIKYDPTIGMMGFDVCVTINRKGKRIMMRRRRTGKVGKAHIVKPEEAQKFISDEFEVNIEKS